MTIYSLVPAVLKALHMEKHILTKEECRSVGEAGRWWFDELALMVQFRRHWRSWDGSRESCGTEELLRQLQVSVYALYVTFCGVSETVQHQASPSTHVYHQQ